MQYFIATVNPDTNVPEFIMNCKCPNPEKKGKIKLFDDEWSAVKYIDNFPELKDRNYQVFDWPYDTDN